MIKGLQPFRAAVLFCCAPGMGAVLKMNLRRLFQREGSSGVSKVFGGYILPKFNLFLIAILLVPLLYFRL